MSDPVQQLCVREQLLFVDKEKNNFTSSFSHIDQQVRRTWSLERYEIGTESRHNRSCREDGGWRDRDVSRFHVHPGDVTNQAHFHQILVPPRVS